MTESKPAESENSSFAEKDIAPKSLGTLETRGGGGIHLDYPTAHASPPQHNELAASVQSSEPCDGWDTRDSEGIHLDYPPAHALPPQHNELAVSVQSSESCDGCDTRDAEGIHLSYPPAHASPPQHN
ncbi:Ubiquitin-like domain-containing protein [Psidium guajava]|nr:Ubiquitin-like domain-containing protein [Psidium guajava]